MFYDIIAVLHIFICVGLIGLVLIQHGKGADAGAAFGSGASATVFGSQGSASFLTRTTAVLATTFFVTSLTLAYFSGQHIKAESVLEKEQPRTTIEESEVPAVDVIPQQDEGVTSESPEVSGNPETATGGDETPVPVTEKSGDEEIPVIPLDTTLSEEPQPEK